MNRAEINGGLSNGELQKINPQEKLPSRIIAEKLAERVVGQNEACLEVGSIINNANANIIPKDHLRGLMLFYGPTGSGKSRMGEAIAMYLGGKERLITIDCPSIQIATPNFQANELYNILIRAVPSNNNGDRKVLLFDKIDYANSLLIGIINNIMNRGAINVPGNGQGNAILDANGTKSTNGNGVRSIPLNNYFFVFTASEGCQYNRGQLGFVRQNERNGIESSNLYNRFDFLDKLDKVIEFKHLEEVDYKEILKRMSNGLNDRLSYKFSLSDDMTAEILARAEVDKFGAWGLKQCFDQIVRSRLADYTEAGLLNDKKEIVVDYGREGVEIFNKVNLKK